MVSNEINCAKSDLFSPEVVEAKQSAPMSIRTFVEIFLTLDDCESLDHFIADRGWQDWMDMYAGKEDQIVTLLSKIWDFKNGFIHGIKKAFGLTQKQIAEKYRIPIRTVESWSVGERNPPEYVEQLIVYNEFRENNLI